MANKYVDASEDERWKRKYFDVLDELEKKESRYQQIESLLRSAVVRISLGVDPQSEKLNKQLDGLREFIRQGQDTLKLRKIFDDISESIKNLTAQDNTTSEQTIEAVLHEVINKIDWPRAAQTDQQRISKQYTNLQDKDIGKFVSLITTLVNRSFVHFQKLAEHDESEQQPRSAPSTAEPQQQKTVEQKNAGSQTKPETSANKENERLLGPLFLTLLNKLPASMVDEAIVRRLKLLAAQCTSRDQALVIIDGIIASLIAPEAPVTESEFDVGLAVELLTQFLEQIIVPVDLSLRAEELRESLMNNRTKQQVMICLEGCVEIVTQMQILIRNERKELEKFLDQISTRLQEIDQQLKRIAGVNDQQREGVDKINQEVEQTTSAIEQALTSTDDIDALKSTVKSHVIMIRHHLDTYFEGQTSRGDENDLIVKQLAQKLIAVKQEAEELRAQLEQRRLEATHDPLTRIPNRLAYQEWIEQEHSRFEKFDTPFVLMVWDVDYFKRINDEYGHLAGDKVLRIVAQMLAEQVREADFVARYGGEEFVVVLPGTTIQPAMQAAEKIRVAISSCAFHFRQEPVSITASCGFAECRKGETIEGLFQRADEALYKAKNSGRNTCIAG